MSKTEFRPESPLKALLSTEAALALVAMGAFYLSVSHPDKAVISANSQVKPGHETQEVLKDVQKLKPYKLMMKEGHLIEAVQESAKLLEAEPNDVAVNWCAALIAMKSRRYDDAFNQMKHTLALVPKNRALRLEFARNLVKAGKIEEAIAQYKLVISQAPNVVLPRMELASLYMNQNRPQDAANELEALLQLKPTESNARKMRGLALAQTGKAEQGMNEYLDGVVNENASGQPQAVKLLLGMWGDIDKAKFQLERQMQENPDDAMAKLRLAEIYLYMNKPGEAKPYLLDARKLKPENPEIHRTLCVVYKKLGNSKQALTCFMQSIAQDQANNKNAKNR